MSDQWSLKPEPASTARTSSAAEARATLIHNERTKLLASALDRISTTFVTTGIATPIVGRLLGLTQISLPSLFYTDMFVIFALLALLFHLSARHAVGRLR